jgi:hypothetical protein
MNSKKSPLVQADADRATTNSGLIAILATILEPEAFKDNAGPAIRRAERIVRAIPQFLDGKNPNLREVFETFKPELEFRNNEAREWGFSESLSIDFFKKRKRLPEGEQLWKQAVSDAGAIFFRDAITDETFKEHKTVRGLTKFLKSVGYPEAYLQMGVITKVGYQRALEKRKQERLQADAKRKRESRKKAKSPRSKKEQSSADKIAKLADV